MVCCPEGTVRATLTDVFTAKVEEDPVDLIIPLPTGRTLFFVATRHFVPGYLHSVPSGQILSTNWPRIRHQIIVRLSTDRRSVATHEGKKHVWRTRTACPTKLPVCRLQTSVASVVGTTKDEYDFFRPRCVNSPLSPKHQP
jgi:hypothetical protein